MLTPQEFKQIEVVLSLMDARIGVDERFVSVPSVLALLQTYVSAEPPRPMFVSAEAQHQKMIEEARKEFRKADAVEGLEPRQAACVGGSSDGDFAPVDPKMPVGAYTDLGGQRYQLCADGKLHFAPIPGRL